VLRETHIAGTVAFFQCSDTKNVSRTDPKKTQNLLIAANQNPSGDFLEVKSTVPCGIKSGR
jgi:hypothetical protein